MGVRESSLEAHEAIKPDKKRQHRIIIETLENAGKPLTSYKISTLCSLDRNQVARRMSELRDIGVLIECGRSEMEKYRPILWGLPKEQ